MRSDIATLGFLLFFLLFAVFFTPHADDEVQERGECYTQNAAIETECQ